MHKATQKHPNQNPWKTGYALDFCKKKKICLYLRMLLNFTSVTAAKYVTQHSDLYFHGPEYQKTDLVKPVAVMQQGSNLLCNSLIFENKIIKPGAIKRLSASPFPLCSNLCHLVSLLHSEHYCGPFLKLSFHFLFKSSIDLAASCRNVNQTADRVQRAAVRASGQSRALHKK